MLGGGAWEREEKVSNFSRNAWKDETTFETAAYK